MTESEPKKLLVFEMQMADIYSEKRYLQASAYTVKHCNGEGAISLDYVFETLAKVLKKRFVQVLGKKSAKELLDLIEKPVTEDGYEEVGRWDPVAGPDTSAGPKWVELCSYGRISDPRHHTALKCLRLKFPWNSKGNLRCELELLVRHESDIKRKDTDKAMVVSRCAFWQIQEDPEEYANLSDTTPAHELYCALDDTGCIIDVPNGAEKAARKLGGIGVGEEFWEHKEFRETCLSLLDCDDPSEQAQIKHRLVQTQLRNISQAVYSYESLEETYLKSRVDALESGASSEELQYLKDQIASLDKSLEVSDSVAEKYLDQANQAKAELKNLIEIHAQEMDREKKKADSAIENLQKNLDEARKTSREARKEAKEANQKLKAQSLQGIPLEELEEERARSQTLENTISKLDDQLAARDNEIRRLEVQVADLCDYRQNLVDPHWGETSMPVSEMLQLPKTLDDVLSLAEQAWPERLRVLKSAHKSAKECEGRDLDRCWQALCQVAECLWSLHFVEHLGAGETSTFTNLTGFDLVPHESKTVSERADLRAARTFDVDGTPIFMPGHVSVCNGGKEKSVRLHFIFDEEAKQIVIGHFGKHLPNTMS